MSLLYIPEITYRVISSLDSCRDVAAVSLSCRALHSMCNMTVRKKFHLIRVYPDDEGIEQAFRLLMDILKRPVLGQYIHEMRYYGRPQHGGNWHIVIEDQHRRNLSEPDMDLLRRQVGRAGFTGSEADAVLDLLVQKKTGDDFGRQRYFKGLCLGMNTSFRGLFIAQALAAMLISVAPNLRSLAMTQPSSTFDSSSMSYYPLERFLHRANGDPDGRPYLQNLQKVYMMVDESGDCDDGRYYIHIEFIDCFRMFDRLPSIMAVGTDALTDDDQDEPTIEQGMSNLTKLQINHSSLNTHYLARAILSCKVLKELQYSIGGRAAREPQLMNHKTFTKAILRHKGTLESLDIDSGQDTFYLHRYGNSIEDELGFRLEDFDEGDIIVQLLSSFWGNSGSLKDFLSLKRLSMGIGLLLYLAIGVDGEAKERTMLVDCLPSHLEYLRIRGYQRGEIEECDAQIDALMTAYQSGSTTLQEVRGVEEMIPHAEDVENPDEEKDLVWTLEGAGYGL